MLRTTVSKCATPFILLFSTALLAIQAWTSFISVSEFWPVTLSREFFNWRSVETSLYFKPVFHLLLAPLHLLPIDNWSHILLARSIFAVMAIASIYLLSRFIHRMLNSPSFAIIYGLCMVWLLTSPLFVSQSIKIRSDQMSLFISLCILNLFINKNWYKSSTQKMLLFIGHLALLGTTPRALFYDLIVLVMATYLNKDILQNRSLRKNFYFVVLVPLVAFTIVFSPFIMSIGNHLLVYYRESFSHSSQNFYYVREWIFGEPITVLLLILSLLISIYKRNILNLLIFASVAIAILLADIKSAFLLASLVPLVSIPFLLYTLPIITEKRWRMAAFIALFLIQVVLFGDSSLWLQSNAEQKEVIVKLSEVLKENPLLTYFDGIGILPLSPQILSYLGPDDEISNAYARQKLNDQKPNLILYTQRTLLLGNDFTKQLLSQYRIVGSDLFLKNERTEKLKVDFSVPPILLFSITPLH